MKPALVILAAGMGSRYGGLKQIDTVGDNGESIIDFSIYDAHRAGFEKVYLIIRKEHEEAFNQALVNKVRNIMEVEYVYQDLHDVPAFINISEDRTKPLGTTHALLALRKQVKEPFMIINADDFYGRESYQVMWDFLNNQVSDNNFGMIGYELFNTISDNGTVTRGVCEECDGYLSRIVEVQKIKKTENGAAYNKDDTWVDIGNSLVSMNYWGFTPKIFDYCSEVFNAFLKNDYPKDPLKSEHVIPTAVGTLINQGKIKVQMLQTSAKWFGITYQQDKENVVKLLKQYKAEGIYPHDLWVK